MAGVILSMGMRGGLIADGTKRPVGLCPEVPKHGSMLAQQRLPSKCLLPALLCEGLGADNPLLKREQLSTGGGQLVLHRDQGGCGGFLALFRLS